MRQITHAVDLMVTGTKDTQDLPATQRSKALVILYGPPCVGKTTVGILLARTLAAYRLPMENASSALREPNEIATDAMSPDIFQVMQGAVVRLLREGTSLVCEGAFADTRRRVALSDYAKQFGATCVIVRLTAPRELLHQRLANRIDSRLDSEGFHGDSISHEKLDWFLDLYDRPFYYTLHSELSIDTAVVDTYATVAQIKSEIAARELSERASRNN